jgi:hypothetical protein
MTKEELYSKIDKFCNETDWKKYPTYENALEEFINGIVAEETKELRDELNYAETHCLFHSDCPTQKENEELKEMYHESDEDNNKLRENIPILAEAKDHIKRLLDCLKQDTNDPQTNYYVCQYMDKAEQFLSEVEK